MVLDVSDQPGFIVDVIIPALDEAATIEALLLALKEKIGDGNLLSVRHIVVADNGSRDATPRLAAARGAIVVHELQRGYGAACLKAIDWIARLDRAPDAVAFIDADLSDDPVMLPDLLSPLMNSAADLVIGSRTRLAERGSLNLVQRFGNALACGLIWALAGRRYSDLGPFRAISWRSLQQLDMTDRTWGWTVEMQMKAALLGWRTIEVDVPYRRRRGGRSKISGTIRGVFAAGSKIIRTIVVLWWNRKAIRSRNGCPAEFRSATRGAPG